MPIITVHHLDNSRSQRILWLLEELGLPYTIRQYKRNPATMRAPRELKEVHPLGKAPVVSVDEEVYAESGAIIEGLIDRFGEGRLRPAAGTPELTNYRYFMHYAEGSLMPPLLVRLITSQLSSPKVPFFVRPITKAVGGRIDGAYTSRELSSHGAFLQGVLAARPWFAGDDFTAADVQMSFPLEAATARAGFEQYPAIVDWIARIRARPAYLRAVERGGAQTLLG